MSFGSIPRRAALARPVPWLARISARLTYANVAATLAVFIALGGGAYAAGVLPKNSVGPKQIKKNAVDGSKIKDGSLTGDDIKEATLDSVPTADSAAEANHAASALAIDKVTYKAAGGSAAPQNFNAAATATCDAGQHVIGGGVKVDDPSVAFVVDSYPDAANTAWTAHVGNGNMSGANVGFTAFALCTTVTTTG